MRRAERRVAPGDGAAAAISAAAENARVTAPFTSHGAKSSPAAGVEERGDAWAGARVAAAMKGHFLRLPQEPEDAPMTGSTRSLNRRLLGLNLTGSASSRGRARGGMPSGQTAPAG